MITIGWWAGGTPVGYAKGINGTYSTPAGWQQRGLRQQRGRQLLGLLDLLDDRAAELAFDQFHAGRPGCGSRGPRVVGPLLVVVRCGLRTVWKWYFPGRGPGRRGRRSSPASAADAGTPCAGSAGGGTLGAGTAGAGTLGAGTAGAGTARAADAGTAARPARGGLMAARRRSGASRCGTGATRPGARAVGWIVLPVRGVLRRTRRASPPAGSGTRRGRIRRRGPCPAAGGGRGPDARPHPHVQPEHVAQHAGQHLVMAAGGEALRLALPVERDGEDA